MRFDNGHGNGLRLVPGWTDCAASGTQPIRNRKTYDEYVGEAALEVVGALRKAGMPSAFPRVPAL
jgi:hypothetical protein